LHPDADFDSEEVELLERTQEEEQGFLSLVSAWLGQNGWIIIIIIIIIITFIWQSTRSVGQGCSFINESEEWETYLAIYPPLIKKFQDKDKHLKLLIHRMNGNDFTIKKVEDVDLTIFQGNTYMPKEV
jgi:hypothetical protein